MKPKPILVNNRTFTRVQFFSLLQKVEPNSGSLGWNQQNNCVNKSNTVRFASETENYETLHCFPKFLCQLVKIDNTTQDELY